MTRLKAELVVSSEVTTLPTPAGKAPFAVADYKLVNLDDQGNQVFVPLLARSYTKAELLMPAIAETLHRLGWPHIEKN